MMLFTANGRAASCLTGEPITTNSVGMGVRFSLSDEFEDLSAIAVFSAGGVSADVVLTGDSCTVPAGVLTTPFVPLRIGVYARDGGGTVVIPTVWAEAGTIRPGATPGTVDPTEPIPDWTAQVQKNATDALAKSEEAMETADEALHKADQTLIDAQGYADAAAEAAEQAVEEAEAMGIQAGIVIEKAIQVEQDKNAAAASAAAAAQSATAAAGSATAAAGSATAAAGSATAAAGSATAAAASAASAAAAESLVENLVLVQPEEPTAEDNVLWIESGAGEEIQVPTWAEFSAVKGALAEPFAPAIAKGSYIGITNGKSASSNKYARTGLLSGRESIAAVNFASVDYEFTAIFYDETGNLNGSGYLSGYDYSYGTGERVLPDEAALFGLSFRRKDQANLTDADVAAITASLTCVKNVLGEIGEIERRMENSIDLLPRRQYGTITTNGGIGTVVNLTPAAVTNYIYVVYPCKKGDVFQIAGSGGSGARLWCITDNDLRILNVAAANRVISPDTPYILTAAQDGYLIYNHFAASETSPLLTVTTLLGGHSDEAIVEIIRDVTADDIAKTQKIDRYILSRSIADTFLLDAAKLPAHPWDDDNGVYSPITAAQMYAQYDALVEAHPEELTAEVIGTASDGTTPIKAYRFAPAHLDTSYRIWRPKIMVNCATHGWEKCGTETMLLLLKILFEHWDSDPLLEVLRWDVDWVIVPVSNPYGFDHNTRKNANGIDLNRNYAPGWSRRVTNPSSQTYQGEAALSEPESIAINALMLTEKPDIGIDFHDFGQSSDRCSWVAARPGAYRGVSINAYHLAQVCQDKTNRRLVKTISFLAGLDPTTLGKVTDGTYPIGLTADAYYYNGAKFAYTFETCGMLTIDPEAKRFSDAHALICIDAFANFVAQNLQQLYRVAETFDAISTSDEPEPEPDD